MTWIQIAHQVPGRTRLRVDALCRDERGCERLADVLAAIPGVREVAARPYTGSVLVHHKREVSANVLADAAARALGGKVLAPGTTPPVASMAPPFSSVARKLVQAMREIDRDIRIKTEGSVDLGTLATLGFFGAGAAEVAVSGKLPMPPWFNLAWWGYRTFMTAEREEIEANAD